MSFLTLNCFKSNSQNGFKGCKYLYILILMLKIILEKGLLSVQLYYPTIWLRAYIESILSDRCLCMFELVLPNNQ